MKEEIEHLRKLHRLVWLVTWMVFICLMAVAVALAMAIGNGKDAGVVAAYASAGGPLLAALSVALIADRQIKNDNLRKKNERDLVVVQSMHHVIFLAQDLKDHVGYIAKSFKRDDVRHPLALLGGHEQIRQRFEDICGGHTYQWIADDSLAKLHTLRGSIYGICLALAEAERHAREKGVAVVPHVPNTKPFDDLIVDLETFIQAVLRARKEIDYWK